MSEPKETMKIVMDDSGDFTFWFDGKPEPFCLREFSRDSETRKKMEIIADIMWELKEHLDSLK